jgi:hypothetical protein
VRNDKRKFPAEYQAQISRALADSAPNVEPTPGDVPNGAENPARFCTPCRVHIHSVRHRLADADGVSGKAALDGLVHAAILRDDSPKEVKAVTHSQEQGAVEYTEITIEEC